MNADGHGLKCGEVTGKIIGCAMDVLNELAHGLHEKPYENALVLEFGLREISVQHQSRFPVMYKGMTVGEYIPDLIACERVVVDTKAIDKITDHELGQMINYLKISGRPVGLIINFKYAKLQWKRVVL
jgi:GxxExxY protein